MSIKYWNSSTKKRKPILENKIIKEVDKLQSQIEKQIEKMMNLSYKKDDRDDVVKCLCVASYSILQRRYWDDFLSNTEFIVYAESKKWPLYDFIRKK